VTQELIYPYQPLDRLVFAARLPIALLALLLGAVASRWAREWFGSLGAILTLLLLTFDPNLIAHAGVAATDLGTAFFVLLALYTFQRFLRRSSVGWGAAAGVTLGLALSAKLSTALLFPVQGLLVLVYGLSNDTGRTDRWRPLFRLVVSYVGIVGLAALVLWALYGFQIGLVPELGMTLPAPAHAVPWLRLQEHMQQGHAAFLMGEVSHEGWWYYFPVALVLKTPLPILLAWVFSFAALILGRRRRWPEELALLLFPALYFGFSLTSSLNIGYRHLLPILPLLAISVGRLNSALPTKVADLTVLKRSALGGWVGLGLGLWLIVGTLSVYPQYLAYFNEVADGPDGGYRFLVDSNTDWGQALKALARHQEEHGIDRVRLSMFTFLDPAIYGVRYEPLTPMHGDTPAVFPSRFNPPPGVYVISTTTLQGIPLADPEMFDWFRHRGPDARIAHVMHLYRVVASPEPGRWVAQCFDPVAPLPPDVINEGFGRQDLRRAYFDCNQSWLLPDGGATPGWYALAQQAADQDDGFIGEQLSAHDLVFEQRRPGALPPFKVFEATAPSIMPALPSANSVQVGDLDFLGHTPVQRQDEPTVEIWTYWRVRARPDRPLSLMLHLTGSDGSPLVADGLGVPVDNWQVGDLFLQRHLFLLPAEAPVYSV
jgi:hypothetical protein